MPAAFLPPAARGLEPRFTLNGSDTLELHLAQLCTRVRAGVRSVLPQNLDGLALAGGYGRGEGGVLKTPAGDRPYNDLEFYVFVRRCPWFNERRCRSPLHALSAQLEPMAGVELEFKLTSVAKLRRSPLNLFSHDLVMGHRWLLGDDRLLHGCDHHRAASRLPLSEATRLLMNRCSGLLFARERLEHSAWSDADADFVGRNIAKTELALGDAVLIVSGAYNWSCRERGRRLAALVPGPDLPWLPEVRRRHAAGVAFKLEPTLPAVSRAAAHAHFHETSALALRVWLWLEQRRLGCEFRSAADYAANRLDKWRGTTPWRNRLTALRVFGPRGLRLLPRGQHPRERILNALALLLWSSPQDSGAAAQRVRRELLWPGPVPLIPAYRQRWRWTS